MCSLLTVLVLSIAPCLQVQEYNAQPFVVVLFYPAELTSAGILTTDQSNTYLEYFSGLSIAIEQQQVSNAFVLLLEGAGLPVDNWCAAHPNLAAHQYMAAQISRYMESTFSQWVNETFPQSVAPDRT